MSPHDQPPPPASAPVPPAQAPPAPSAEPPPALHLWGLSKAFGPKIAVNGISLAIPPGSSYGIVGPNGAGKTTSLLMATGLLRPDHGTAFVHGVDIWAHPAVAKSDLGVLPDGMRLFDRLTGRELIVYAGLLRGMPPELTRTRTEELLEVLDLTAAATTLVSDYSAGMRKKVALGCALIHAPRVLVLDEPFESVDPVSAGSIRVMLDDFIAGGGTVVLSSHVMDLVQRMCSHVAVISHGNLVAAGTVAEVSGGVDLETRFAQLVGAPEQRGGLSWLRPSQH
ncbi:MAG TPA: ABC transporter ATP-binding protein [Actinomycetaceae bacterium]|nr:ABC transporter ATP-binding protein [Actinomycetaceae bacterium]